MLFVLALELERKPATSAEQKASWHSRSKISNLKQKPHAC